MLPQALRLKESRSLRVVLAQLRHMPGAQRLVRAAARRTATSPTLVVALGWSTPLALGRTGSARA